MFAFNLFDPDLVRSIYIIISLGQLTVSITVTDGAVFVIEAQGCFSRSCFVWRSPSDRTWFDRWSLWLIAWLTGRSDGQAGAWLLRRVFLLSFPLHLWLVNGVIWPPTSNNPSLNHPQRDTSQPQPSAVQKPGTPHNHSPELYNNQGHPTTTALNCIRTRDTPQPQPWAV